MKRAALLLAVAACSSSSSGPPEGRPEISSSDVAIDAGKAKAPPHAATAPDAASAPAPAKLEGADFTAEAKLLFRVAACGNQDPLPANIDPDVVARHCKAIQAQMDEYRTRYVEGGRAFFDELVPKDVPKVIVYPFGGGDLISALLAFPDATEITTISLELAGDPRRIDTIDKHALETSLSALRVDIGGTLQVGSNTSDNLQESQQNDLPGQVCSFLLGLAATGNEPVGMRYFKLNDDGSIHYLEQAEIDAMSGTAKSLQGSWTSPNFSEAFSHVEIRYRKAGDPTAPVHVHRHLGWNLGDDALTKQPQLLRHLEAKGKVTMMTKGASYLLWRDDFAQIRDYMLGHLAWMISDSTGIPPRFAEKAGMVMETYGTFEDAFLPLERGTRDSNDFAALWRKNPHKKLPFRFGYVDANKSPHLVITHPAT